MQAWQSREFDLLVIDTAGRMQSKENLMRELEKIGRDDLQGNCKIGSLFGSGTEQSGMYLPQGSLA